MSYNPPKVTGRFESAQQNITLGSVIPVAHGLAGTPAFFHMYMECVAAELNYAVGDRVRLDGYESTTAGTVAGLIGSLTFTPIVMNYGGNVVADSTNITAVIAKDGIKVLNRTPGASTLGVATTITPANWKLVLIAYF